MSYVDIAKVRTIFKYKTFSDFFLKNFYIVKHLRFLNYLTIKF